jgi:transposase
MRYPPNRPDTVSHLASVRHTTVSMSNPADRVEIITSVQRRRRWAAAEKVRMVEETFEPGMTVSLVARRHGVAPNQLFTWRRLVVEGALTAAGSGEQVVPASDYRALQSQVRELQRLLGKKTLEAEILKEALEHATGSKKRLRLAPSPPKDGSR